MEVIMKDVHVADGIVPLGEFKSNASHFLKELDGMGGPLVVTQNGRPAAVVLSPRVFEEMRERYAVLKAVSQGLADAESGNVVPHSQVADWLSSWGQEDEGEQPSCE